MQTCESCRQNPNGKLCKGLCTKCYHRAWYLKHAQPKVITKTCTRCAENFNTNRHGRKHCSKRCIQLAWSERNRPKLREKGRDYYHKNKDRQKHNSLKRKYGLTLEQYHALFRLQGGSCASCNHKSRRLVVDHCHISGFVRGLLCDPCNTSLGQMESDPSRIRGLLEYAEKNQLLSSKAA